MKTKFNVSILKRGTENEKFLSMIASHNEGLVPLDLGDLVSFGQCCRALYPTINSGLNVERLSDDEAETEEYNSIRITEDGGKTFTLIIQQVEIHELANQEI